MEEISIYIHFPYCELKCPYCDFNSHVKTDLKEQDHLQAFKNEIDFFASQIRKTYNLRSIFFGGGTPSLMSAETIFNILEHIKQKPEFAWNSPEVTLEANPSSSEYDKFKNFKDAGVNRLSIGVQSFNQGDLKFLGRKHNTDDAKNAILMAKEIFENYSFDLIYCLPNQTLLKWEEELEFALKYYVKKHLSAYTLTIEKGTKFFKMHENGNFILPKNEEEFYISTNKILQKHGFERYEISNYAKQGYECLHNLSYWSNIDYIGIGAGAHGRITIEGSRYTTQNFASPDKYLFHSLKQKNAMQVFEKLSQEDVLKESLIMGLRNFKGLNTKSFRDKYGFDLLEKINLKHLNLMQENGLIKIKDGSLILTSSGLNLVNSIVLKLCS